MIRTRLIPVLALTLVALDAGTAYAQRGSKLPPDIPVTTTIADAASGWFLDVRSDLHGAYVRKVVNKVQQVESALQATPNGYDFMLRTYGTAKGRTVDSDRRVYFDLSEQTEAGGFATPPLDFGAAGEPLPYGLATSLLLVRCSQSGVNMLTLVEGQSAQCSGSFRFRALDGSWYRLAFNPENVPGVDRIAVTCAAADSGGCKVWTLTPAGTTVTGDDPNAKNQSVLLNIDSGGNVLATGGRYNVSFSLTIAR